MANQPPQTPPPPQHDVQALGLVALHRLAQQGHGAARAELERRMRKAAPVREAEQPQVPRTIPASPPVPPAPRSAPDSKAADAHAERLTLMAQLAPERDAAGPPRLVGLVLIAWGLLLALGGLTLLAQNGNAYYVYCGLACAAVGVLLMRCSAWATHAHLALLVLALAWGWRSDGSALGALASALPLLIPLLWLAVPSVRAPLR